MFSFFNSFSPNKILLLSIVSEVKLFLLAKHFLPGIYTYRVSYTIAGNIATFKFVNIKTGSIFVESIGLNKIKRDIRMFNNANISIYISKDHYVIRFE